MRKSSNVSTETRNIHLGYYAVLREQRGLSEERLATAAATPRALYEELRARHGFRLGVPQLRVVVNDEFGSWDTPLQEGDHVVFIPPVAGG
ncbi:MAG: MoaD/ThiS family protein [Candidatus Hydrogenedentes bacterium]|nr:MoaD/ThiS family protein [Candidatus Hydrogenedentota bacterium]MBI3119573.1 MoaD/ThiS family protein [Candidatus Hydrogenedentota bacterium]